MAGARDHPRVTTEAPRTVRTDLPTGTVTFLFTDIEGSTRLSQELGDEFATVIDRHHQVMRASIADFDGVVVSTEGDAFFAVFREATLAIGAAAQAQRGLAAEPWPKDCDVRVRMGLHTGAGHLGGDDYAGVDVNRAARISDAGHGGQVLLSEATAKLVGGALPGDLALRDLGAILLKDFEQGETVLQLDITGQPSEFPPLRAERPGWLPAPLTTFLGREAEIDQVAELVATRRLVTLTGPGGTGKTRLSIETARRLQPRFPGGAWFVPLEAIREPALVLPQIADRLGIVAVAGQSLRDTVAVALDGRRTLLVLDNLEQVIEIGPDLGSLLESTPGLSILASSREPLRIGGEQEFHVPVLDELLAVELFIERARQVRPDLDPDTDEQRELHELVQRLDRLPLAIELAAARARRFSVSVLCERVTTSLAGLDSGRRDAVDRQRTLRGAVDWSYQLLDGDERSVFDRLAIFAGGVELDMAGSVIDPDRPDDEVLDLIESLADKSLLAIEEGVAGEPRTRTLETIHAFATERLKEDPARASLAERHALRFLELCEAIEPDLTGERTEVALARMEEEHDNVRRALDWSLDNRPAVGLRIGGAIWRFWQQRAHLVEGQQRLQALLEVAGDDDVCALARGCTGLAGLHYWLGDHREAKRIYTTAVESYRACGDEAALAGALYDLAYPTAIGGDLDTAIALTRESRDLFASIGDDTGVALVKEAEAVMGVMAGEYERSRELQLEVVAERRAEGGPFKLADNLGMLLIIDYLIGRHHETRVLLEEMRTIYRRLSNLSSLPGGLASRAMVANGEADHETAALCAGALQRLHDDGVRFLEPASTMGFADPTHEARERLGDRFDELFELGRSMDPEHVFLEDDLGPAEAATD